MNFRKMKTSFLRNQRAISPVIATLLMIAIAVVASLVAYAWVMGYMGFTTDKTSKTILIQSVDKANGDVYVQNVGDSAVQFDTNCVYVNGAAPGTAPTLTKAGVAYVAGSDVFKGETLKIDTGLVFAKDQIIKVTSKDGSFSQVTVLPP
jgi:flagellin-like protein